MSERLERDEEADFCKRVSRELHIESTKLNLQGNRGWPDRIFWLPNKPALIEFKRGKEKPFKLQTYRILQLTSLGYDVLWTSDYELAFNWLKELVAARVSGASDKTNDWSGLRGAIPGPRTRKNLNITRGQQDPLK